MKGKETIKGCNSLVTGKLESQLQRSEIVGLETKVLKCFGDENIMQNVKIASYALSQHTEMSCMETAYLNTKRCRKWHRI